MSMMSDVNPLTTRLQLIDADARHFKYYNIRLESESGLFLEIRAVIERGRIGQRPQKIVRYFSTVQDAEKYFNRKKNEKLKKGYVEVGQDSDFVRVSDCPLCKLLSRARSDSCFIYEFDNSVFFLNWDQTYRGRSMLVFKNHIEDFFNLAPSQILQILPEIRVCERALKEGFGADRINYLFMGNQAGHFHLHFVPRYKDDANWGSSPFLDTSRASSPQREDKFYENEARIAREAVEKFADVEDVIE